MGTSSRSRCVGDGILRIAVRVMFRCCSPWRGWIGEGVEHDEVCRATGGHLTAQLEEVAGTRWIPIADLVELPTPSELPELRLLFTAPPASRRQLPGQRP